MCLLRLAGAEAPWRVVMVAAAEEEVVEAVGVTDTGVTAAGGMADMADMVRMARFFGPI